MMEEKVSRTFIYMFAHGDLDAAPRIEFETLEDLLTFPGIHREINAEAPSREELQDQKRIKTECLPRSLAAFEELEREFSQGEKWKQEDFVDMGDMKVLRPSEDDYDFYGHRTTHSFMELVQSKDSWAIRIEGEWRHLYSTWFNNDGGVTDIFLGYFNGGLLEGLATHRSV